MAKSSLHDLRNSWQIRILGISFVILSLCEVVLILDVSTEFLGFEFDFYHKFHGLIETTAVTALGITLVVIGVDFLRLIRENSQFRSVVGIASGEFLYILGGKFNDWKLSSSEREIALLLIKGLSIQEIADIRVTRPGTIKSQCSAVYRKAEVKGRNELVAYFVEDLLAGDSLTDGAGMMPPSSQSPPTPPIDSTLSTPEVPN
ncbi:MAG: helix-turn-helix transcriptional regulator [Rhodospirillales bacterium]|nr:helix-turn-helix transcriptional regulator [Rhodospirillales bacterium]